MDTTHPWHDPQAPARYRNAIRDLYRHLDQWVGRLVEAAGEQTNVIVMSDHGAGPLYRDVFLNEWLLQKGWLTLREGAAGRTAWFGLAGRLGLTREKISEALTRAGLHRLEVLIKRTLGDRIYILPRDERPEFQNAIQWELTRAYSFGYYGQVFINLVGREPGGVVPPGRDYEALRDGIASELCRLIDPADGLPVVDRVYKREELFHGPFLEEAPDLLAIMRGFTYMTRKGYEFAAQRGILFREPYTMESGSHRLEGILIAAGPDFAYRDSPVEAAIQDLAPTLLQLMACPIPTYMDGRPLGELFTGEFSAAHPAWHKEQALAPRTAASGDWSAEDEAEVVERLKNLGYLG
jgi:predicted AlkP superfamily phosphohydrolase/phosphomutase